MHRTHHMALANPSRCAELSFSRVCVPTGGRAPVPRWRHTATAISETDLLVIGGYSSSSSRLNDVWRFNLLSRLWIEERGATDDASERSEVTCEATDLWDLSAAALNRIDISASNLRSVAPDVYSSGDISAVVSRRPDARGGHSAVLLGDMIVVFGGHGGAFQRKKALSRRNIMQTLPYTLYHSTPPQVLVSRDEIWTTSRVIASIARHGCHRGGRMASQ